MSGALAYSFDYRVADVTAANIVLNREWCPLPVRLAVIGAGLVPALAGLAAGVAIAFAMGNEVFWPFGPAGMLIGAFLALPLQKRVGRWTTTRIPSGQAREGEAITFEVDEDGFRIASKNGEAVQRWGGVYRVLEGNGLILFEVGLGAHVLPARAFASGLDRKAAIDWILARLPAEARARSTLRA